MPANRKPKAWNLKPQMTAMPEAWRGAKVCLPLWDLPLHNPDADVSIYNIVDMSATELPLDNDRWGVTRTLYGPAIDSQVVGGSGGNQQVDLPNFIGGKDQFTVLSVVTPRTVTQDQTIVGAWNVTDTIILHFDNNSQIRFLLAPGTVGDWTSDTYSAGERYAIAARLAPNGEMAVWMNGSKNVVRSGGSPLTVATGAADLGYLNDTDGATNKPFEGTSEFLYGSDIALGDDTIAAWSRDPFAMLRPAGF